MPSLEELRAVAAQLRPLTAGLGPPTSAEQAYLAAYGIDFGPVGGVLEQRLGAIEAAGETLAVHVIKVAQPRGNLLLVHGYFDHVGIFGHLLRYGIERGYNVVAFDLPGHGLSTGPPAVIEEFRDYAAAMQAVQATTAAWLPGAWQVIAQSTGGAAVLESMAQGWRNATAVVMLAPLVRPLGWHWVRPAHAVLSRFREALPRKFANNSNDPVFLEFLRNDPLQSPQLSLRWIGALRRWLRQLPRRLPCEIPVLVLQGDLDQTVDGPYNTRYISAMLDQVEVVAVPGARHQLANESEPVRQLIAAGMDEFLGRYPCG